jgi:tyrosine recombinase XerC subunit
MNDELLSAAVTRFLRYLGVERQLSPITLLNYQRQLDAIIELAQQMGLKRWQQCDAAMVRSFATAVAEKGWGRPAWRYAYRRCAAFLTGW